MKKILTAFLLFTLFVPLSCSKNQAKTNQESNIAEELNTSVITLYENKNLASLREKPFSVLDDHSSRVDKVGYGSEVLNSLKINSDWIDINKLLQLDLRNIEIRHFDYTDVSMITIPINSNSGKEWLLVYYHKNEFVFAIAKESGLPNGNKYCAITALDGSVYYDFEVSPENRLGKMRVVSSIKFQDTFKSIKNRGSENELNVVDPPPPPSDGSCCSKPFSECMNCFLASCSQDWQCWILCGFGPGPVICAATWATACISHSGCGS